MSHLPDLRPATVTDAAAVAALEQECLGEDAWSPGLVAEVVAGTVPTVRAVVAEVDGSVAGYAAVSVVVDVAELQRLAVTPVVRRRGVATALVRSVLALARDGGADRVLLEVREDNDGARALYAGIGFSEVGTRPRYYRDGSAAVLLEASTGST